MSIAKAIQGLDIIIKNKQQLKDGLLDPMKSWNQNNTVSKEFVVSLAESLQFDVKVLTGIKTHLLPEQKRTKIICRHPKKFQDIVGGHKYCMNCNADL